MPILRVNIEHQTCRLHGSTQPLAGALNRAARGEGPIIVMIAGFSHHPGHPVHCPHRRVLGLPHARSDRNRVSWPRALGFGTGHPSEGLAIALGWNARGSIWAARRRANAAGRGLAALLTALRHRAPHRQVHILTHSMGVEVAAAALPHLPGGAVCRIVSMTGAAYQSSVRAALDTPAGRHVDFFNVVSRFNSVFDTLYERLISPPQPRDRALGRGLDAPNALTLDLDCADTLTRLGDLGLPIAPPATRICHWSTYTRPGALECYRAWLRAPGLYPLEHLRTRLTRQAMPCMAASKPPFAVPAGRLLT